MSRLEAELNASQSALADCKTQLSEMEHTST